LPKWKEKLSRGLVTILFQMSIKAQEQPASKPAIWFYPSGRKDDDRVAEALSGCADTIVLMPGPGADASKRRPQLVECFVALDFCPITKATSLNWIRGPCAFGASRGEQLAPVGRCGDGFCQTQ